jgi:DNA repair exonuclease SbcCD nuclease subunit
MKVDTNIQVLFLSDIHFGEHQNSKNLFNELQNMLYKQEQIQTAITNKTLKLIVFGGDYWGTKLSLTSIDAQFGIRFINELYQFCKIHKIFLRMLKGTLSHDLNQLEVFEHLVKDSQGLFRIFDTVGYEALPIDETTKLKVLYVPEEYIGETSGNFYKKVLSKPKFWDFIFGHGTFDFSAFSNQKILSERSIKAAPILDSNKFNETVKGAVLFGHIHIKDHRKRVFYPGSFSRLNFGEEEPKGCYLVNYDYATGKTNLKFLENTLAPIYKTIQLSDYFPKETIFTDSNIEEKVLLMSKLCKKYANSKLRIIDDTNTSSSLSNRVLKETFNSDSNLTLKLTTVGAAATRDERFDFILKKEYPTAETIQKFVSLKYNTTLDLDFIKKTISEDNTDNEI